MFYENILKYFLILALNCKYKIKYTFNKNEPY